MFHCFLHKYFVMTKEAPTYSLDIVSVFQLKQQILKLCSKGIWDILIKFLKNVNVKLLPCFWRGSKRSKSGKE